MQFIDLRQQYDQIKAEILARLGAVLEHGQYIMGPEVAEMEEALAHLCGTRHCIAVASGTEALLIALMAKDIGPGVEVIVPAFTFAASAEVVALVGATPVLVDIEPDTGNISVAAVEAALSDRTRAVMPVSLYGQPADMAEIVALGERHSLTVIEDAAQSFGAEYQGRKSCALSEVGCTSFFPSKPLGCYGDGGAIFCNDDGFAQACREIRVHGQSARYRHDRIGVGGRMDTLQCAVILAKLPLLADETERRLAIGGRYNGLFDQVGVRRIVQRDDRTSVFAQYTIMVDQRDVVRQRLEDQAIPTAIHYPAPLSRQRAYADISRFDELPHAEAAAASVISLPMHPYLTEDDQDRIVDAVEHAVKFN